MNLLDLDDKISWEQIYLRFIKNDLLWSTFQKAISSQSDDDIFKILTEIDDNSDKYIQIKTQCYQNFIENYTHVAAYHACRPNDINSYLTSGIIPANTDKLIEIAKDIFQDSAAVDSAVLDIRNEKRVDSMEYGSDKIWFFISRTRALKDSQYLEYGSELIKIIAGRLGAWAEQKLSDLGTPTIFKCKIPISWLSESVACFYSTSALTQLLAHYLRSIDDIDNTINGAFCIERCLPKDYIRNIKTKFPNSGFHKRLNQLAVRWFFRHPLNPLPFMKW